MNARGTVLWRRIYQPGRVLLYADKVAPLWVTVEYGNDLNPTRPPNLSITAVEGPKRNGNADGSCGQCRDSLLDMHDYSPGWDAEMVARLRAIWDRWHGNDMRAGCEHQRAEGWAERPIDPEKPTNAYGKHFPGQRSDSWNMLAWVRPDEFPGGLLTAPCSTCGYKYGTAWLNEPVPDDVLAALLHFPAAERDHPWGDAPVN